MDPSAGQAERNDVRHGSQEPVGRAAKLVCRDCQKWRSDRSKIEEDGQTTGSSCRWWQLPVRGNHWRRLSGYLRASFAGWSREIFEAFGGFIQRKNWKQIWRQMESLHSTHGLRWILGWPSHSSCDGTYFYGGPFYVTAETIQEGYASALEPPESLYLEACGRAIHVSCAMDRNFDAMKWKLRRKLFFFFFESRWSRKRWFSSCGWQELKRNMRADSINFCFSFDFSINSLPLKYPDCPAWRDVASGLTTELVTPGPLKATARLDYITSFGMFWPHESSMFWSWWFGILLVTLAQLTFSSSFHVGADHPHVIFARLVVSSSRPRIEVNLKMFQNISKLSTNG